jgi:RNA polymerase sigma factor (sigma-70 family)
MPAEQAAEDRALGEPNEVDARQIELLRSGLQFMAMRALGDADAAADVVQETLLRALTTLGNGRLTQVANLGAFVRGIARHVIADALRERRGIRPFSALPNGVEAPGPEADPLSALVDEEQQARVREALAQLGGSDRDLLRLCYCEGLSPAELSERLGEPATRIRKRKSRALERLRRVFFDRGGEESRSAPVGDYPVAGVARRPSAKEERSS